MGTFAGQVYSSRDYRCRCSDAVRSHSNLLDSDERAHDCNVKPYTPLELAGRQIYISEGCYNCHSQQIRPMVAERKRYGEYSKPGEFIYDHPFQWGSRRIGPDLAREGGRQSSFWHWTHFENPALISPGSVMPEYGHLLTADLNFKSIQRLSKPPSFWELSTVRKS